MNNEVESQAQFLKQWGLDTQPSPSPSVNGAHHLQSALRINDAGDHHGNCMQQSSVWGLLLACCETEAEPGTPLITVTQ